MKTSNFQSFHTKNFNFRFDTIRNTLQGKQEERLPWFSFVLPPDIKYMRSGALENFKENKKRLTTPFDIHATFLDILGINENENYDIRSRFPPQALSLFGPVRFRFRHIFRMQPNTKRIDFSEQNMRTSRNRTSLVRLSELASNTIRHTDCATAC